MKYIALFLLLTGMATPSFAQHPEDQRREQRRREAPSPENNAKRTIREFKKEFQLTEKEYDKVYELYLKYERSLIADFNNGNFGGMPPRGGMGMPGGGPGGFGGFGMGGGMGMPPQGGFPPSGDFQMPGDMKSMMEDMRKEQEKKQEKAHKNLKKKMKKILKGDQYTQWEAWETQRKKRKPEMRP